MTRKRDTCVLIILDEEVALREIVHQELRNLSLVTKFGEMPNNRFHLYAIEDLGDVEKNNDDVPAQESLLCDVAGMVQD